MEKTILISEEFEGPFPPSPPSSSFKRHRLTWRKSIIILGIVVLIGIIFPLEMILMRARWNSDESKSKVKEFGMSFFENTSLMTFYF